MTPLKHARLAAAANDVDFDQVVVIQVTNNVVSWLQPSPVVVKVDRWAHSASGLLLEHAVARYLGDSGAPVAEPIGDPYRESTTSMVSTLWTLIPRTEEPPDGGGPANIAACLATVYAALTDVAVELGVGLANGRRSQGINATPETVARQ